MIDYLIAVLITLGIPDNSSATHPLGQNPFLMRGWIGLQSDTCEHGIPLS